MKTYLRFSIKGELEELKTKDKFFDKNNLSNYSLSNYTCTNISYNNNLYILLSNIDEKELNITKLPFYDKIIYGPFYLFKIQPDYTIQSMTEYKFLNLLTSNAKEIPDYSSDDFAEN